MAELDALGDVVSGAMLAGAVEPKTGLSAAGQGELGNCLNCGTPLNGAYCVTCGQKSRVHRSLRGFFQDMVQGLFNFEGKIWRTLPLLAWRPGELTRRYIAGERARFVSPVALYLFSVFLMFAVLNFTGTLNGGGGPVDINANLRIAVKEQKESIASLEKKRATKAAQGKPVADLDRKIRSEKADLIQLQNVRSGGLVRQDPGDDTPPWLRGVVEKAQENPELVVFRAQDAASKFSWLLIPLSIPFMWLLFPFSRRFRLYDHTVFVTYSLSFMMMLAITGGLLVGAGSSGYAGVLFLIPPFHMYRQLKGAYQLSRFGALWRTTVLTIFAFVAALLFAAFLFALGALG